jgi:hypothetical protein
VVPRAAATADRFGTNSDVDAHREPKFTALPLGVSQWNGHAQVCLQRFSAFAFAGFFAAWLVVAFGWFLVFPFFTPSRGPLPLVACDSSRRHLA